MENTEAALENQILSLGKLRNVWRWREISFPVVGSLAGMKNVCKRALVQADTSLNWWPRDKGWGNLKREGGREGREKGTDKQRRKGRDREDKVKIGVAWEAGSRDRKAILQPSSRSKVHTNSSNIHFPDSFLSACGVGLFHSGTL